MFSYWTIYKVAISYTPCHLVYVLHFFLPTQYLLPTLFGLIDLAPIWVLSNNFFELECLQKIAMRHMLFNLQIIGIKPYG
jgi:hypothetical protein